MNTYSLAVLSYQSKAEQHSFQLNVNRDIVYIMSRGVVCSVLEKLGFLCSLPQIPLMYKALK